MIVPSNIQELVELFGRNLKDYKKGRYNETQVRIEFIDPLFKALGWDVDNKKGFSEAYKEVVHEDAIKIGGATKAPDYSFRVGGIRKFFLEAKKPSVDIKGDIHPAYQLRRYAWSAKLPLSILTDFEELAVYDCRIKPVKTDKASTARVLYMTYSEYLDRWDELTNIFSIDAIQKGYFDKFVAEKKGKRGTAEVDAVFLQEIERWREMLAKNFALRNPRLSQRDLNFAVQRTIDRIIFLRICEDRGIESYGTLMALQNGARIYPRMFELFHRADERYNSGLFHFKQEKDRADAGLDELTPELTLDDKILKELIKNLYYPDSPYEFSVLPADILGQVYEQFLGKVIRLTPAHRAIVETKPEVRKAGGVYYTPTYIVDYIVKQTVGKLLEGKKPGPHSPVSQLKILDPACGSGSFLLGAYQYLLNWHRDEYIKDGPEKWTKGHSPRLYQNDRGDWKLTTDERKRILLDNIYGVDIDPQAVEVTKLSLLLKVLEGENDQTLSNQLALFHQRALPDLVNNIKCGNSLIGPDFYDGKQMSLLDEEEMYRINVFDWQAEFPEIMTTGGFDAVIGNPPYGFHQIHSDLVKVYFKQHLESSQGSFEHYFLFYEQSLKLLNKNGLHGFIVPVTWLMIPSALSLRKFILSNHSIQQICWLPEFVFVNAKVNTLISIIKKSEASNVAVFIYDSLGFRNPPKEARSYRQGQFVESGFDIGIFGSTVDNEIIKKIKSVSQSLQEFARPCSGYNPYEVGKGLTPKGGPHTKETITSKPYHSIKYLGDEWKPEIVGRDLDRYFVNVTGKRWIKYGLWLAAARDPENFKGKRILVQEITGGKDRRIVAAYYEGELYHSRDVIPIKIENDVPDPLYLLGLINSRLITWFHLIKNPKAQKGLFPKVLVSDLKKLPIRPIDFSNSTDIASHDQILALVERMLDLHKQLAAAKTPQAKTVLQRQIDATDKQIDQLVYELYDLTEKEIKIVEESLK